eukprot:4960874-Amphidinium_carterae.1
MDGGGYNGGFNKSKFKESQQQNYNVVLSFSVACFLSLTSGPSGDGEHRKSHDAISLKIQAIQQHKRFELNVGPGLTFVSAFQEEAGWAVRSRDISPYSLHLVGLGVGHSELGFLLET